MRRIGEPTLVDTDDAGVQSLEDAVSDAEELIGNGDESRARRLHFAAELAAIRLESRRAKRAIHCCASGDDVCCKEDDVRALWVDTDSSEVQSYTTTLSTWRLDAPLAALDHGDVRRWYLDWKRHKKLGDRVCHETRGASFTTDFVSISCTLGRRPSLSLLVEGSTV